MSFHNKPDYQIPELIEALKAHRLPHDTPSQLADSFRIGWMACRYLAQADSGFDYKTAADFLSGKTVSDEALRKFVAASRGAHDGRAALHAKMLSLQGELASREAEIALLKRSLLDAEADAAAPQPSTTAQSADSVPAVSDLPPLPAPDLRDVGTKPQEIKEFLKGYATEYARTAIAARAPADSVLEDAALLDWLEQNLFHRGMDEWDAKFGGRGDQNMWVLFAPKGVQGSARRIIDAATKAGGITLHI